MATEVKQEAPPECCHPAAPKAPAPAQPGPRGGFFWEDGDVAGPRSPGPTGRQGGRPREEPQLGAGPPPKAAGGGKCAFAQTTSLCSPRPRPHLGHREGPLAQVAPDTAPITRKPGVWGEGGREGPRWLGPSQAGLRRPLLDRRRRCSEVPAGKLPGVARCGGTRARGAAVFIEPTRRPAPEAGDLPWPRSCSGTAGGGCVDTLVARSPRS